MVKKEYRAVITKILLNARQSKCHGKFKELNRTFLLSKCLCLVLDTVYAKK